MNFLRWLFVLPIRFYQRFISRYTPATCRFQPTCSDFGLQAIQKHGILKGSLLILWRLLRCQPLCRGGYDPVPEAGRWKSDERDLVDPED